MKSEAYKMLPAGGSFQSGMRAFLKGFSVACIMTLILLSISALLLTYTPISEDVLSAFSMICVMVSVFVGGAVTAKSARKRGLIKGALIGGAYIFTLFLIASLAKENFTLNAHTWVLLLIGVIAGAFGGIVGINTGGKRKR